MATETYRIEGVAVKKYTTDQASDKAPIIMVHGGDHAGWCWEKWATFFSEAGHEVHVLDWYNHGESDKLPEAEFLKRSILDVARREITYVANQLQADPILFGHSMGGLAAVEYATTEPVKSLVLIAPVMTAAAEAPIMPLPVDMNAPVAVFPYPQAKQMFFTKSSDEDAKRYYDRLEPESPQAVMEATRWSDNIDLTKVSAPTLVVAAEFDQIIPAVPLKHYDELLGADFIQAAGVGHSDVLLKDPEWQTAATQVRDWLDKN